MFLLIAVETIKNLDGVNTRGKIELIFILLGEKPATEFFVDSYRAENICDILLEIGMECRATDTNIPKFKQIGVTADAARMEEYLPLQGIDHDLVHENRGTIYGFPKSAVDAYARSMRGEPIKIICLEELPEEVQNADFAPFCQFAFSENWQEELAIPKRWSEIAKQYAPELHAEFLRAWEQIQSEHKMVLKRIEEDLPEDGVSIPPIPYTVIKVENRWGQALPENKVRWLDNGKIDVMSWEEFQIVKKWQPELTLRDHWAQKMHHFTPYELSNVEADDTVKEKMKVRLFGEYKRKIRDTI